MTEQTDWRAKQPSQAVCTLEALQCWGTRDTNWGHKAKNIAPSIAWRRGVQKKRTHSTVFLERARDGHRQSDKRWNCFKLNIGEWAFPSAQIPSWTELNWTQSLGSTSSSKGGTIPYPMPIKWLSHWSQCPTWSANRDTTLSAFSQRRRMGKVGMHKSRSNSEPGPKQKWRCLWKREQVSLKMLPIYSGQPSFKTVLEIKKTRF